jgi:hypothetical protein
MSNDTEDPKWVDVKDLPSQYTKRRVVEITTRRDRLALGLIEAIAQQQHKDVLVTDNTIGEDKA